jgi:hypothetical protein
MQDICKQKGKTEIIAGFEPTKTLLVCVGWSP